MPIFNGKRRHTLKQGEIYWVKLNPTEGAEVIGKGIDGARPCVIVSPDPLNENLKTVIVAPCTSTMKDVPFRQGIRRASGDFQIMLDQLRTVDKGSTRFLGKKDQLTKRELSSSLLILRKIFSDCK